MKINYEEAIENLQKMFSGVEKEVIQTILTMHKGKIDPTIEDLLKLTNDTVDEDNIFDDDKNKKSYVPALDEDSDDDYARRQRQEERDMELALQLQEQEVRSSKRAEQQNSLRPQIQGYDARSYGRPQYQPQQQYPSQQKSQYQQQYQPQQQSQYQPQQQPQYQQRTNQPSQSNNSPPVKEEKKKKKFSEKMKDAKAKFFSLFKKGKKKGKAGVGNNLAGGYAEVDNLEDINNINEIGDNAKVYDDLDDIPDIEANPYSNQNPYSKSNGNKKIKPVDVDSEGSEDSEEGAISEEAKANFNFNPVMNYSKPDFDSIKQKNEASYPKFEENEEDPELKEYYNDKKIKDQGEELI